MAESAAQPPDLDVSYRDPLLWALPLAELAVLASLLVLDQKFHLHLLWAWVGGLAVIVVSAVLTAVRARRGFTLSANGLIWHKHQISVPWSNVTGVEAVGDRVVVRVAEPDQLRDRRRLGGLTETPWNVRRHGAPIAPKGKRLGMPAAEFAAEAELRRAAFTPGGLRVMPQAKGAFTTSVLNIAGVVLALLAMMFGDLPTEQGVVRQRAGMLVFEYRADGPDADFAGQTLTVRNYERLAVAPTLAYTAQDADGRDLPGVSVRTAFGSDRGLVVIAGRGAFREALAFDGPRAGDVRRVKVAVPGSRYAEGPYRQTTQAEAFPIDRAGGRLELGHPFDRVRVPLGGNGKARLICVVWEHRPTGRGTRLVTSYDFGRIGMGNLMEDEVTVPAAMRVHTPECGSLHGVYTVP
ncbi:hypothetical protein AB0L06_09720 [Spirillospora sp. NPDC052269]